MNKKKVTVAKGVKLPRGKESKERARPGGGSTGKYKHVTPGEFAGKAAGISAYSFPLPDAATARCALARAHFAPDPASLKAKVYRMYPELKKHKEK